MLDYTTQDVFKIRDAWNILYELEFLENFFDVYRLQQISAHINTMLDNLQKGGDSNG